jgi:formate-dependent nitrite reductase membrane component NrfD
MKQLWEQAGHARRRMVWFERIAASLVLVAVAGSALLWRNIVDRRRGEEASQQVITALRITNHALERMNIQLDEQQKH